MPDINKLWEEKAESLSSKVKRIARGNDDFYQQGLLGIRDGLLKDPYATDSYLLQAARFSMDNYKNKGKSIDNGSRHETTKKLLDGTVKTYKKDMVPVCMDNITPDFPDLRSLPNILALDRICAERFYRSLDKKEAEFIDAVILTSNGDFSDKRAMRKMAVSQAEYYRIKEAAYEKFIRFLELMNRLTY